MLDLVDHFVLFLMKEFYQSLEKEMIVWTENLVNAVKDNDPKRIEFALKYIDNYRDKLNDLQEENMDQKDFVGLIAEQYGFVRKEKS